MVPPGSKEKTKLSSRMAVNCPFMVGRPGLEPGTLRLKGDFRPSRSILPRPIASTI